MGAWLPAHSLLSDTVQTPDGPAGFRRTASRLGSPQLQRDGSSEPNNQDASEEEQLIEFKHGFSLEYVIQIVRPGQGPHVMEIHLEGAQLQWPYVMAMDFVWDLANAYKHYFCRPWVAPYPEVTPMRLSLFSFFTGVQCCHAPTYSCSRVS